ncbi:MAG: PQQ-dependent sugar dehydrogenase, partial [candidate division Zixibacteria bacterium]|nr:PQQ-dependent sugar dehydrogenase [candidate division Zixibacteria bacterium]
MHSSLAAEPPLGLELIANGFSNPVLVTHAPNDSNRIFVVEQVGRIKQVDLNTLTVSVFLDITSRVITGGERGLLGLAFHPDYQTNGQFYVNYSGAGVPFGRTVISRFNVSANPNIADASSEFVILTVNQPEANHNGGMIAFGPNDGFLYIGMGDGGGAGDLHGPKGNSQDTLNFLGKMLRIDVDGGSPYAIPASNPFTAPGGFPDEVWAYGLRNPWRWSFDRLTGDMYIGDVGQNLWEEIDFEPAASAGGVNWGWRLKEATHCFNPAVNCDPNGITTDPILEYLNDINTCSVTGGYVYRGCDIAALQGAYFYADFCTGEVWTIRYDGNSITDTTLHFNLGLVSSFGEDAQGEIYICDFIGGAVSKVVPVGPPDICNAPPDTFFLDIDMQAVAAPEPPSGEQAMPVDELQGVVILCSAPNTGEYFLRLMAIKDASGDLSGLVVEALIPPNPCNLPVSVMSSVHFMPGNMLVLNHDLAVRNIAVSFSGENGTPSLGQWQDFPFLAKPADVGEATDLAEIPGAEFDDGQPRLYISTDKGMILMIGRDVTGAIMLEDTLTPSDGSPISSMAPIPQQTYLALGAWADGVLMGVHPCFTPRTPQFSFVHPNLTSGADFAGFE